MAGSLKRGLMERAYGRRRGQVRADGQCSASRLDPPLPALEDEAGCPTVVEVDWTTPGSFDVLSTVTTLSVARESSAMTRMPPERMPAARSAFFGMVFL